MVSSVSFGGAHSLDFYTAPSPVFTTPDTGVTALANLFRLIVLRMTGLKDTHALKFHCHPVVLFHYRAWE